MRGGGGGGVQEKAYRETKRTNRENAETGLNKDKQSQSEQRHPDSSQTDGQNNNLWP